MRPEIMQLKKNLLKGYLVVLCAATTLFVIGAERGNTPVLYLSTAFLVIAGIGTINMLHDLGSQK